jgi:hypothetical protein
MPFAEQRYTDLHYTVEAELIAVLTRAASLR